MCIGSATAAFLVHGCCVSFPVFINGWARHWNNNNRMERYCKTPLRNIAKGRSSYSETGWLVRFSTNSSRDYHWSSSLPAIPSFVVCLYCCCARCEWESRTDTWHHGNSSVDVKGTSSWKSGHCKNCLASKLIEWMSTIFTSKVLWAGTEEDNCRAPLERLQWYQLIIVQLVEWRVAQVSFHCGCDGNEWVHWPNDRAENVAENVSLYTRKGVGVTEYNMLAVSGLWHELG